MIGFIVVMKRKHDSKPEIVCHSVSNAAAEAYAQDLYYSNQLDMVLVAEVNRDPLSPEGVYMKKVMKIERICKHPNLQADFISGGITCMKCGMVVKEEIKVSSIVEQSPIAFAIAVG